MRRKLDKVVLIKGAGEVASGVAARLFRCNLRVVLLELPEPRAVRRPVAFSEAVYDQKVVVEGITGFLCETAHEARFMAERGGVIPVLVDADADTLPAFGPIALIDARMRGRSDGTSVEDAPLVIGLGPGFVCGVHAHMVVETCAGPRLGRVITEGQAEPDPDVSLPPGPGTDPGCVVAPAAGIVIHSKKIGDLVEPSEVLCSISGAEARSRIGGLVTGLIREGVRVEAGWKLAQIDPRGRKANPSELGYRPLAIAGGVLEAMMSSLSVKARV